MSSALFKLRSRNFSDFYIEESKNEIDIIMNKVNHFRKLSYNLHILLHLCEDRLNFGPLIDINAYAYENQLQSFKYSYK